MKSPRFEDYVEAKLGWLEVTDTKVNATPFLKAYDAALADARKIYLEPGKYKRIGVAFGSVYTPEYGQSPVTSSLASIFSKLGSEKFDAAAWCFPMAAQGLKDTYGGVTWRNPGVVVLAGAV